MASSRYVVTCDLQILKAKGAPLMLFLGGHGATTEASVALSVVPSAATLPQFIPDRVAKSLAMLKVESEDRTKALRTPQTAAANNDVPRHHFECRVTCRALSFR